MLRKFPGKVRYLHRDYPVDLACNPITPDGKGSTISCRAAYYARCAARQGKFAAMDDGRTRQAVLVDITLNKDRGVPVALVNGEKVVGARDLAWWEKKVRSLLGGP